jgi:hypothetical protein
MLESPRSNVPWEMQMPAMKFTVRLSFANGEQAVASSESPATSGLVLHPILPPYRLAAGTAPEDPTLVSSASFVRVF